MNKFNDGVCNAGLDGLQKDRSEIRVTLFKPPQTKFVIKPA